MTMERKGASTSQESSRHTAQIEQDVDMNMKACRLCLELLLWRYAAARVPTANHTTHHGPRALWSRVDDGPLAPERHGL